ncbi:MAG TPA: magnesium transporter [Thermomicrobiales bacterium]|nr:magnesium transporter [Thermomicrobiales bacterium]
MEQLTATLAERLRVALDPATAGDAGAPTLTTTVRDQHPADLAAALRDLAPAEALAVFAVLDDARAAEVLDELDPELTRYLIAHAPPGRIADLLDRLPMDDAAEVVAEAGDGQSARLLTDLAARAPADATEVRALLAYPEGTAGRLMTDKYAAVPTAATAAQVLQYLRSNAASLETVDVVYVVDGAGRLLGACPLRRVFTAGEWQPLREVMDPAPLAVAPETDQAEVARAIARYDLAALPVVAPDRRLLGIVTVDDAIDVLVEEFTADYLRLAGTDAEEMERRTPAQIARLRLPWLLGTMGIELCAGLVIARFDDVLTQVILLASFMPVISAVSGNIGLQAAATVVRGLDTGHVSLKHAGRQVGKELTTALLLALACGLVLGAVGAVWSRHLPFGLVIGGAMTCSMLTAGFMGTVIPMLSKRLGFDPATTAGPFETAFQDVIGFAVFLWLASLLLQWLR